ncbi:hypothetical protein [Clostridium saccharobutylicum]|uniref:Uncharacterized protein n=1 Tax=Clostridium saccharobutylicum TaxID=169679 RepID=A0A1S8NIG6_CLOSA|nr:hypothetical protein [Clostridium saccharobutylicum]OOM16274.1 hypothetical protein CLOSAC_05450 [Clostridium saccharobutylicum]
MEFKFNKIDTDIRKKMQEKVKEGKIHGNERVSIKKDIKEDDNKNETTKEENNKNFKKRFFTIDGIRYTKEALDIKVEKLEELDEENSRGRILDAKK